MTMPDVNEPQANPAPQPAKGRGNLAIVSVITLVLVASIIALLLHGRTQSQGGSPPAVTGPSTPTTVQITTCQGSPLGCNATPGLVGAVTPSTDQGVTMQVTHAHLDATTTTILVTLSSDTITLGAASIDDGTVTDSQGHTIMPVLTGNIFHMLNQQKVVATYTLLPLSAAQLRQPQQFVFTAHRITTNLGKPLPGNNDALTGTWRNTFTVNPAAGTAYTIQAPSVKAQDVNFSVTSVEIAPSSAHDGDIPAYGGARIMLTATHVPTGTLTVSFGGWFDSTAPRPISCPAFGCPPRPAPTAAVPTLPGFVLGQALNGISYVVTPTTATVGADQTVQIELLYTGSGMPSGANGTLAISNFHLFASNTVTPADLKTTPTFQLPLPLHG